MDALIRSISEWKALDPRVRVAQLRDRDTKRAPERLVVGDRLSPLDLYVYLKARFGPPNGVQMALRNQSSDNLVHWHYTLRADAAVLEIWQANLTTELYLEGTAKPSAEDWSRLIDAIKADYRNYGRAMSQIRKDLERWHLFINPYKRLRDVLERPGIHLTQVTPTSCSWAHSVLASQSATIERYGVGSTAMACCTRR